MTEREKLLAGDFYNSRDPELLEMYHEAKEMLREWSAISSRESETKQAVLKKLFGFLGNGVDKASMRMKGTFTKVLFLALMGSSCSSNSENNHENTDFEALKQIDGTSEDLEGHQLAAAYCGACHLKPEPELPDKSTWEHSVLPDMRRRMGLITADDFGLAVGEDSDVPSGIYSESQLITRGEWEKIREYYLSRAPDTLTGIKTKIDIEYELPDFEPIVPTLNKQRPNLTTLTAWNKEQGILYFGDRFRQLFLIDGKSMELIDSIPIASPASAIIFHPEGKFDLLTMGIMDPSNFAIGQLNNFQNFQISAASLQLDSLRRPVHFSYADLNQNGREDIIICNFGHHIGNLSWYENTPGGFVHHLLNGQPGARKTVVTDLNNDGLPDIVALMTQAKEGVYAYINQGDGKFREQIWLKFNPLFGGSDFEMVDFNKDGNLDIVIVSGDNADKSPILKPYHGIRIFLNNGENQFEESWFYPMYGASGILVEDFDQDGEPDLAVISYFPDGKQIPKHNFLYFKNYGNLDFSVHAHKELGKYSWLTMEKGDLDGDGKMDIVLGGFDFKTQYNFPMQDWIPFVVLKNVGSK